MVFRHVFLALFLSGVAVAQTKDEGRDEAVALAKKALMGTLDQKAAATTVLLDSAESVEWPDASLGCPDKGMMYAQMITPGYRVRFKVGHTYREVHVGAGRAVICDQGAAASSRKPMAASAAEAHKVARRRLSESLRIPESAIKVTAMRPVKPSDDPRGCADAPAPTEGTPAAFEFWVEMEVEGKTYLYRADATSARPCDAPTPPKK